MCWEKESFSGNDGPDAADTWGFSHRHSAFRLSWCHFTEERSTLWGGGGGCGWHTVQGQSLTLCWPHVN